MSKLWNDFLMGETDLREGDTKLSRAHVAEREILYRKYILNPGMLKDLIKSSPMGLNRSANQALYDMSVLEDNVDPKYVFFIIAEGHANETYQDPPSSSACCLHNFAKNCHHQAIKVVFDAAMVKKLPSDDRGQSPLHCAFYFNDMISTAEQEQTVKLLCQFHPSVIDQRDNAGKTALFLAFSQCSTRSTKLLLEHHASALQTLPLYSTFSPKLKLLCDILFASSDTTSSSYVQSYDNSQWQEKLQQLSSHPRLKEFMSPTNIFTDMIDYHQSRSWLRLQKWRFGKPFVLLGMILFRVREELRESKRHTQSVVTTLHSRPRFNPLPEFNLEEKEREQEQFESDLVQRTKGQELRKKHKGKILKVRREHEQQLSWDRKQMAQKDRMENEYQVNLTGLIVG